MRVIYLIGMTCLLFSLGQRSANTNTWTMMDQRRDKIDTDYLRSEISTEFTIVTTQRRITIKVVNDKLIVDFIAFLSGIQSRPSLSFRSWKRIGLLALGARRSVLFWLTEPSDKDQEVGASGQCSGQGHEPIHHEGEQKQLAAQERSTPMGLISQRRPLLGLSGFQGTRWRKLNQSMKLYRRGSSGYG